MTIGKTPYIRIVAKTKKKKQSGINSSTFRKMEAGAKK